MKTLKDIKNDMTCMYCDEDREPGSVACASCYEDVYGNKDTEEADS